MSSYIFLAIASIFFGGMFVRTRRQHQETILQLRKTHDQSIKKINTQRAQEHEAAKKRMARLEREAQLKLERAPIPLIKDLLPTLDALKDASQAAHKEDAQAKDIAHGLDMVLLEAAGAFHKHGVSLIPSDRSTFFDPVLHEAVDLAQSTELPDGSISESLRTGWKHHTQVIRPAMVRVVKNNAPQNTHPTAHVPQSEQAQTTAHTRVEHTTEHITHEDISFDFSTTHHDQDSSMTRSSVKETLEEAAEETAEETIGATCK